jgi:hypothetical protein
MAKNCYCPRWALLHLSWTAGMPGLIACVIVKSKNEGDNSIYFLFMNHILQQFRTS